MTEAELVTLKEIGAERRFAAGTPIVRAGDTADGLYCILSGEVEVLVDPDAGKQLRVEHDGGRNGFR